ncbi:hypothetical protein [Mammaliicoccus lentus]|jgi:hypothetical protein
MEHTNNENIHVEDLLEQLSTKAQAVMLCCHHPNVYYNEDQFEEEK